MYFYLGGRVLGTSATHQDEIFHLQCHCHLFSFIFSEDNISPSSRLNSWKDVGTGDIKIFLAHLIAMGLVKKNCIERYWDHGETVKTPFFGTYMSRNTFQGILSNFQVVNNEYDLPKNNPLHDPLFKVRPFMEMIKRKFQMSYRAGRDLSFDEGCCPFKGRVPFRCYNPSKPAKFHMKLFEVTDAKTGYILGFDVYTGKGKTECAKDARTLDPHCSQTTKVVMGLLDKCDLLDRGHHVYMDNYYTSPELFDEMHFRHTFACGTARAMRKGMPHSVTQKKFKKKQKGACVFRRNGPLLCFKWREKKDVLMLTTIHEAILVDSGKKDRDGNIIEKPEAVYYYCQRMGGVDLNDQLLNYQNFLRKSVKWSRKLLIHFFNMLILNAYILNKVYGEQKLTQEEYRDKIVKYLITEGLKAYKIPLPPVLSRRLGKRSENEHDEKRLTERHFIQRIPAGEGRKRAKPCRPCDVCKKLPALDPRLKTKRTSYWCNECLKPLCVTPCFDLYHNLLDYTPEALNIALNTLVTEDVS